MSKLEAMRARARASAPPREKVRCDRGHAQIGIWMPKDGCRLCDLHDERERAKEREAQRVAAAERRLQGAQTIADRLWGEEFGRKPAAPMFERVKEPHEYPVHVPDVLRITETSTGKVHTYSIPKHLRGKGR